MGAARIVVTMTVLGLAAGAALAVATVPAFAPYREREPAGRDAAPRDWAEDGSAPAYAQPAPRPHDREQGLRIEAGPRDGTVVLELPRWAQGTGDWLALGQRAFDTWHDWFDPGDRPVADREQAYRYAEQGAWRHRQEEPGYAPKGEEDTGNPGAARQQLERSAPDRDGSDLDAPDLDAIGTIIGNAVGDAAAQAAARAREAARDAREAERDAQ